MTRKLQWLIGSLVILSSLSYAQTATVTATIVDPNGQAFANGTWSVSFNAKSRTPSSYNLNGSSFTQSYSGTLSGAGALSVTLTTNTAINPQGSEWYFQLCPDATSPCSTISTPITTSGDISSTLNAGVAPIQIASTTTAPYPRGYADSEVTNPVKGSTYYRVTDNVQRTYNGSTWASIVSGGASINPTLNTIPKRIGPTSFGDSQLTDNGTQISTGSDSLAVGGSQPYNVGTLDDGANGNNCAGMNMVSVGYYAFCGFSGGPLQLWYNGANPFGNILTSSLSGTANGLATLDGAARLPGAQNTLTGFRVVDSINTMNWVGTDVGAWINSADSNIGSGNSGVIQLNPTAASGNWTATTLITLTKGHSLRIIGNGTLTTVGIRVPDSSIDVSAISEIDCPDHATIFLANGANTDLISDSNFATLSGSGNTFGTYKFTLRGCQLNGNKANQTALVTTSTGTVLNVARSAGGVVTVNLTSATTPAFIAGETVCIGTCLGTGTQVTTDGYSFNGRFIIQSVSNAGATFTFNNKGNTVGTTAIGGTAIGFSGSNGVRIYGRSMKIEDVQIANSVLDNLWTEGITPVAFTDDTTQLEATFRSLRLINANGDGWVFWGPQQSHSWDVTEFNHGHWGREIFSSLQDVGAITYLNTSGSLHVGYGGGLQQASSQETSAGSGAWGILVDNGAQANEFSSDVNACNSCTAVEFRSAGQLYMGTIQNSTTGVKFNGGTAVMNIFASNITGNLFDCTSLGGSVVITGINADTTGSLANANCAAGGDPVGLLRSVNFWGGSLAKQDFIFPKASAYNYGTGFTYTFPSANITFAGINASQTFTGMQSFTQIGTASNCQLGGASGTASPAGCNSAASGVVAIPASQTTYTVNTNAVTANSHIIVQQISDNSGIPSSPVCNATATNPIQTARVAATSFTFTLTSNAAVTCYQYWIVD